MFDLEVNFDKACKRISLLEKEIVKINNQVQKKNGGGDAVFYRLPLFYNPSIPMKTSCNLNACPFYGLWYVCNNFMAIDDEHTFHPWCVATHVIYSLKCHVVGYEFPFTKEWCATWGIRVLGNASSNNCVNTPIALGDNINILKDPMPLLSDMEFDFLFSL